MASFLGQVGRANITENVGQLTNMLRQKRMESLMEKQQARADESFAMDKEARQVNLDVARNKLATQKEAMAAANRIVPVDVVLDNVMGGREGPVAKFMTNYATQRGLVDEQGGIKQRDLQMAQKELMSPPFVGKLSDISMQYAKSEYDKLIQASKDPEFAKSNGLNPKQIQEQLPVAAQRYRRVMDQTGELRRRLLEADILAKEAAAARTTDNSKTPAIKEFEYGQQNPAFKIEQDEERLKDDAEKLTGDISQFFQLKGRKPRDTEELKTFLANKRLAPQPTLSERETIKQKAALGRLQELAAKDPNMAYSKGYRMTEDGEIDVDFVTKAPIKLQPAYKILGKRGLPKAMKIAGETWDDAKQLQELLRDPQVASDLEKAKESNLWDRVKGKWGNQIKVWMQKNGIAKNSKTATAISRMQMMASKERKEMLGSAVTATELESILAWMPSAGDSFDTIKTKTDLFAQEGGENFNRWLDLYKDTYDMSPFYKAFGLKRFPDVTGRVEIIKSPQQQQLEQQIADKVANKIERDETDPLGLR